LLAVVDVTACEAVGPLEIHGNQDLTLLDQVRDAGRVSFQRSKHRGHEQIAAAVPSLAGSL
jgi:hypothetical protein